MCWIHWRVIQKNIQICTPMLIKHTNMNSGWILELSMKVKTIKTIRQKWQLEFMTVWRQRFLSIYENNNTYKENNNLDCIKGVSDSIKKFLTIKNWKRMTGKFPPKVLCRFNEVTINIYGHFFVEEFFVKYMKMKVVRKARIFLMKII